MIEGRDNWLVSSLTELLLSGVFDIKRCDRARFRFVTDLVFR